MACRQHGFLNICSYQLSCLVSPLENTQYLHKADGCKFLWVSQNLRVHV